ncbi:GMC family oxidoreductase [Chromobacterium sp. IIBBL 290-4]|uniref:GMC family oxidoreductase n=1 Tax=Chromobacterium sp. IIBBL 290-4 TaxID=2953890 RepID=UPI0020B6EB15|nr:GMC family oxidoreductase [Chromobacterium sp. IIBBL 290-4]UTH75179.1 GMC family oxidoreductase [Chromobacterium sp. IIBBL 290-4]
MKIEKAEAALSRHYDVVIVGAGIMGAILARRLAENKRRVLLLEAGNGAGLSYDNYSQFLENYYRASAKVPQSPYPENPDAPQPDELTIGLTPPGQEPAPGYFIQRGPLPYRSTYTRYAGGTTLHWLGTSLRMLPEDFRMQSLYGQAQDWPLAYESFSRYYEQAEWELGVSADVEDQSYHGQQFPPGYVYPMHGLPPSLVDQAFAEPLRGQFYELDGQRHPLDVIGTPAARNGIPNPRYNGGKGYQPVGAVGSRAIGHRCMGNTSCVPICPVQAKYNAMKTLVASKHDYVTMVTQCVASRLLLDPDNGRISGVEVKSYDRPNDPAHKVYIARGDIVALCAAPVENAKLMLASGVGNSSGLVGVGIMDHPELLTWGLTQQQVWPFRGPIATSGIEGLRWGDFRSRHASFRIEIGNEGWGWPTGSPGYDVQEFVGQNLWGKQLQRSLIERVTRQVRFGILVEQLPEAGNRVVIDPQYRDPLGNFRPVIHYDVGDYSRAGFAKAREVSNAIFQRCGIADHTTFFPDQPNFSYAGQPFNYQGAGHYMGGHRMGSDRNTSVVDANLCSWDHNNLYLVGCGSMTTSGTSNPTLTGAALSILAAERIHQALGNTQAIATGVSA